ncbi:TPA: helix-turn-helix transcriptional regulator [Streptococcus suis]|nr:helix-turn-helix transcriptional regulator [Streptococcus suis]
MNKLKELRKERNLTQKELSVETGIPYRTIQRWENGETTIKQDKAQELADYFGVSVGYLLGYEVIDLMNTTYLEDYIFFDGDYSNPEKTKAQYFEEISEKIEIYKKVVSSLYGRYDKSKAIEVLELLEKNQEDDLDDIYKILQDKLELALFRYIAQYQLLLPEFYRLDDND